jgi:hypothetical protein
MAENQEMVIQQVFTTPDGSTFKTRQEAVDHIRIPQVRSALMPITKGNEELVQWLIDNQDEVAGAFDAGAIRRVSKKDRKKLEADFEAISKSELEIPFVRENMEQIIESFRWPTVKRMKDEEKDLAARNGLMVVTDNNEEVTSWIMDHKDAVLEAFEAGKIKRQMSDTAKVALEAYRAKKAAEKAAAEGATAVK